MVDAGRNCLYRPPRKIFASDIAVPTQTTRRGERRVGVGVGSGVIGGSGGRVSGTKPGL